jgi:RHS repeat-associated protein
VSIQDATPVRVSDAAGSSSFRYDRHGRVLERIQALGNASPALTRTTQHHYDSAGRLDETTLPSGAVIGYAYGADGRILTITVNGVTIVREIESFPFGEPRAWTEGASANGFRYGRSYDTDGRVAHHTLGEDFRTLSYDAAHRITGLLDSATEDGTTPATPQSANWTFGYDGQDRLASASNAATQGTLAQLNLDWLYDATGNRREETRNGVTSAYTTAPTSNRLDAVGTTSRSYDNAGNTSSDGTYAYTYSARNRLSSARLQSTNTILAHYTTNAFGERVCKATGAGLCPKGPGSTDPSDTGSGSFTQYVYDDAGHLVGEYEVQGCASAAGAGCAGAAANAGELITEHVWLDDTPVAVIKPAAMVASHGGQAAGNVAVFAVEPDHLDTPRVIANTSHQLIWRWDSSPFGDTPANEAPGGLAAFAYSLRFPGQQHDAETQAHYNYFRDYEPGVGRYLESDPIGIKAGPSTYGYVVGSPLKHSDWFGLDTGGVYVLTDPETGEAMRTGRTNDLPRRRNEHRRGGTTCGLDFHILVETDSYSEQRGVEQLAHEAYGKPKLNKVEPISPRNKKRGGYLKSGCDCLKRNKVKLPG